MTVVDIHPEELLEKLVRGELSPAEWDHLEAHLESCAVCRLELDLRRDFQLEAAAIELPRIPEPVVPAPESRPTATRRRRPPRAVTWGIVAAGFVTATAAVASVVAGRIPWPLSLSNDEPAAQVHESTKKAERAHQPVVARRKSQADAEESAKEDEASAPAKPAADPGRHAPLERSPEKTQSELPVTAKALFMKANLARRQGQIAEAARLYGTLRTQFPASEEASLSRITFAKLQLDSGNAAVALGLFNQYLARGGPLEAEALVGRATALRRLGLAEQEARAWATVARRYPSSAYTRQARERLSALSAP